MTIQRFLTLLVSSMALAGCATVPDALQGDRYAQTFFPNQAIDKSIGAPVRWGGTIVDTQPEANQTCVEVLARELGANAHPKASDDDLGRFIACSPEFLDPEIYTSGRLVTAVGTLTEFQVDLIGEFNYRYPVVLADAIYLWPERQEQQYPVGYFPPYYGWGYPYGFGYWGYRYGVGHSRYPLHRAGYIRLHGGGVVRSSNSSGSSSSGSSGIAEPGSK